MAFDMGFNFRQTAGYVTDPAYGVPETDLVYPNTYTNANGYSINAGWITQADGFGNDTNTNDPRIAGRVNTGSTHTSTFKVDLASGSAPGAGTYTVDLACGRAGADVTQEFQLKDNTTVVLELASPGQATSAGHFIDATLADVTASTTWTGTTISQAFATTTVQLTLNQGLDAINAAVAHFRLALQAGGGQSVVPVLMAQYRQRRA